MSPRYQILLDGQPVAQGENCKIEPSMESFDSETKAVLARWAMFQNHPELMGRLWIATCEVTVREP